MKKEVVTTALQLEQRIEKDIKSIQKTLFPSQPAEALPRCELKARKACNDIQIATDDLRNALYGIFCKAD